MTALGAVLTLAYLIGSVPFSFFVARLFGVRDVRNVGSGNVGATNVLRSAGKRAGFLALLLDAAKGAAAVVAARRLGGGETTVVAAAVIAVLGHMYPIWLGFRGGKGVATGAGAFLPLAPFATAAACVVFVLTAAVTRYVSVGSVVGSLSLSLAAFVSGSPRPVAWAALGVALLIVWKHRENLERIARGAESRLGTR